MLKLGTVIKGTSTFFICASSTSRQWPGPLSQ
jgi:hypothetical protein